MIRTERETWVVDSIADGVAAVEVDGERIVHVPAGLLPPGSKEGDVLAMTREAATGKAIVTLAIDVRETGAALERSRQQLARAKGQKDPGGDIVL